jgi:diadenosine tetraphosphate (Ap4A) HIT family hydrolase
MQVKSGCFGCQISSGETQPEGGVHQLSRGWSLNFNAADIGRPWFVLQTIEHRNDLTDLTADEQAELAVLLPAVVAQIRNATGCDRVYTALFNESGHVHFHVVPRFHGDSTGPDLFKTTPPANIEPTLGREQLSAMADRVRFDVNAEEHAIVRGVVGLHEWWNDHLSPYKWVMHKVWSARRGWASFAPVYVLSWMLILIGCAAVAGFESTPLWLRIAVAAIATYRFIDAVLYEFGILLDRSTNRLVGLERSVLLAIGNLLEISIVGATWLLAMHWRQGASVGGTWTHTIGLVTTSAGPVYTGAIAAMAQILTLGGGLLFLAGGVSLLIGALSSRIREVQSAGRSRRMPS